MFFPTKHKIPPLRSSTPADAKAASAGDPGFAPVGMTVLPWGYTYCSSDLRAVGLILAIPRSCGQGVNHLPELWIRLAKKIA